jgi:hypothetical protein
MRHVLFVEADTIVFNMNARKTTIGLFKAIVITITDPFSRDSYYGAFFGTGEFQGIANNVL